MSEVRLIIFFAIACSVLLKSVFGERGTWKANGTYEYYVSLGGISKSFTDSADYCDAQDAELATVKSKSTQQFIESLVSAGSGGPYAFYIALRDLDGDGEFVWEDGDRLGYKNWGTGEPNNLGEQKCVTLGQSYTYMAALQWDNMYCVTGSRGPKGFVCQRKIGTYWGDWSNCTNAKNDSSVWTRNKTCIFTGRPGPEECDANVTAMEKCCLQEPCPSTAYIRTDPVVTSKKASTFSTAIEEAKSTTTEATSRVQSGVGNHTSVISSSLPQTTPTHHTNAKTETTDEPKSLSPLVFPIAGGLGGLLLLIIIVLVVMYTRRPSQKTRDDSVEMEAATGTIVKRDPAKPKEKKESFQTPSQSDDDKFEPHNTGSSGIDGTTVHQQHEETSPSLDEVGYASISLEVKDRDPMPSYSYFIYIASNIVIRANFILCSLVAYSQRDTRLFSGNPDQTQESEYATMNGFESEKNGDLYSSLNHEGVTPPLDATYSTMMGVNAKLEPPAGLKIENTSNESASDNAYDVLRSHERLVEERSSPDAVYSTIDQPTDKNALNALEQQDTASPRETEAVKEKGRLDGDDSDEPPLYTAIVK